VKRLVGTGELQETLRNRTGRLPVERISCGQGKDEIEVAQVWGRKEGELRNDSSKLQVAAGGLLKREPRPTQKKRRHGKRLETNTLEKRSGGCANGDEGQWRASFGLLRKEKKLGTTIHAKKTHQKKEVNKKLRVD